MSIVLKDGTVLPDIPSEVLAKYPCGVVLEDKRTEQQYVFVGSAAPLLFLDAATVMGSAMIMAENNTPGTVNLLISKKDSEWVLQNEDETLPSNAVLTSGDEVFAVLLWANHDVFYADVEKFATTFEPVSTGEIYFANSLAASEPFILPDGTELPALPEGCFEKYPYGMISYVESTNGEAAYALSVAEGTYIFAPGSATGEGSDYVMSLLPGYRHYRYVVAPTAASGWEQYAESTTQHSGHDFSREDGTIEIRWCNHDILTATAMNDDGTPEIGPDLYRKSDVNYRVPGGWLNSMGNQARRLGGVSGALKPGEMETVFKGVSGGTSLAPNERVYQVGVAECQSYVGNSISSTTSATGTLSA